MLLELQAISRLALLFGSTWLTTAIVINIILLMILAANGVVIKMGKVIYDKVNLFYVLLILSLLCSYAVPYVSDWIIHSMGNQGSLISITILTLLPVLLAGIIFAISFRRCKVQRMLWQ